MNKRFITRGLAAGAAIALAGAGLVACASGDNGGGGNGGDADSIEAALEEGGTLTYWTWTPQAEAQVEAFEAAYPNVDVEIVNTASANDNNLKLQNAIAAGKGAPDVVQVEYQSLPQFVLSEGLLDLTDYGFAELEDLYTPGPWSAVAQQGGIWGLPQDSGPMALFYNQAVFDQFGLEVPATWDEYVEAARKLHAADPSYYITNDAGTDAGFGTSMIWQAGGRPFQADGETVTIDLQDEGTKQWADAWNPLVEEGLVSQLAGWSDEWFEGLGSGTIATLPIGAWMPGVLESNELAAAGAGNWRVAPMPTYDGGEPVTAENGGSSEAVTQQSENPALAVGFLKWLNSSDESVGVFVDEGGFPATVASLESEEFLSYESEYFGGQKINEVLADAASSVSTGWQYLPWQSYANSIYPDYVGKAYAAGTDINEALIEWQDANVSYGEEQGFTVE